MRKKLVLFSDGTGNSSRKAEKSNVWRMFQALKQNRCDVLALYDDGVGTSSNRHLAAITGAFGWGLKRNVLRLYEFVCRNWDGDQTEIYGFGFSRGAFTIRTLVGLIAREGLVTYRTEDELHRNARAVYRHFRAAAFPSKSPIVNGMRALRDAVLRVKQWLRGQRTYREIADDVNNAGRRDVHIRFLGLWDTVEAYGMPVLELKRGIDWVLWPMMFGDLTLSSKVQRACHALALDDERTTFHPLLWDEAAEARMVADGKVRSGRITQVWFAGVHASVGGGYPEDQLSLIPLAWMMNQAVANGLELDPHALERVNAGKSPYARLYDSRAGLAGYYRYSPRRIPEVEVGGKPLRPIVHASAILRMVHGPDSYAPITLPPQFWVLAPDGELLPMQGFTKPLKLEGTKLKVAAARSVVKADDVLARERADLEQAMKRVGRPGQDAVELVRDTVWWRRVSYFLTFTLTALVLLFPLVGNVLGELALSLLGYVPWFGPPLVESIRTGYEYSDRSYGGFLRPTLEVVGGWLPEFTEPWRNAFAEHPITFGTLLLLLAWSFINGSALQSRVRDRARLAWFPEEVTDYRAWLTANSRGWRNTMLAASGVCLIVFAGLGIAALLDASSAGERMLWLALSGAVAAVLLAFAYKRHRELRRLQRSLEGNELETTIGLRIARRLRTHGALVGLHHLIFHVVVPVLFAAALLVGAAVVVHRMMFDVSVALGHVCVNSAPEADQETTGTSQRFSIRELCWGSGLFVRAGERYRVTIDTPGDWFDRTIRADPYGIAPADWKHALGIPLKRWWTERFFTPILRIGSVGGDEYPLRDEKVKPHAYCLDPQRYGGTGLDPATGEAVPTSGRLTTREAQRVACAACDRFASRLVGSGIASPISPTSAAELLACSPTPTGRRTLSVEITPRQSGEVFLYVNDAVSVLPWVGSSFYGNNTGSGTLRVERVAKNLATGS